jgi:pyruvate/2-oxoglutarate dehydrogenase complex dihydrolipoamide acyltransferase (E2) component
MQLSLTNMAVAGVRMGIPIVTAPAAATMFIGEPFDEAYPLPGGGVGFRRTASMVMTFDHRIMNGIGAANFLTEVRQRAERIDDEPLTV